MSDAHASYSPTHIQSYFDAYADAEWDRLDADPAARASFHVHRHYLHATVRRGDGVLEVGAGPGRFTIELARLGARVTVGDISPVQLELNLQKVAEAGLEAFVEGRETMDIVDLSRFPDGRFHAVVCYGGPLSYVFGEADRALAEMLRVTRPGGHVLLSVMSLVGATRRFLPDILDLERVHGHQVIDPVRRTGDLCDPAISPNGHYCRMYRWSGLRDLLSRHPCEVVAASASNFLSPGNEAALEAIAGDAEAWDRFLAWEIDYCREPGAIDGGTHILAVVRRA